MQLFAKSVLKGLATWMPLLDRYANSRAASAVKVRYYYSVWLRHLVCTSRASSVIDPQCVAELGPGDSLGLGMAAMLSGADRYFALDRLRFAAPERNLQTLDELVPLFENREPIPGDDEFPDVHPKLADYRFPSDLLTEERLARALETSRVRRIRRLVSEAAEADGELEIRYFAPWDDSAEILPGSVDWVFSQAVLEHVEDVQGTYDCLMKWMRPGGVMSHRIDYSSHGITRDWNGHWTVSDSMWKVVRGRRAYLINRLPHSRHLEAIRASGFRVLMELRTEAPALAHTRVASGCATGDPDDLRTAGAFIVASR